MFELTEAYAARCRRYERLYLSAALKYPYKAIDAAVKCKITIRSFAFAEHRLIFQWVCEAAETGKVHTLESFSKLNRAGACPIQPTDLRSFWWLEIVPTGLESWAGRIADLEAARKSGVLAA